MSKLAKTLRRMTRLLKSGTAAAEAEVEETTEEDETKTAFDAAMSELKKGLGQEDAEDEAKDDAKEKSEEEVEEELDKANEDYGDENGKGKKKNKKKKGKKPMGEEEEEKDQKLLDIEKFKTKAAKLGAGVKFVSAKEVTAEDGSAGIQVVYSFVDIRKLNIQAQPENPMDDQMAGMTGAESTEEDETILVKRLGKVDPRE